MAKVSLYINQEVWAKFREEVFRKYGSLRKLSNEVETILSSALVGDKVASEFKELGIKTESTISSREVKEKRPALRGPPSERLVREMRRKRVEVLSRQ